MEKPCNFLIREGAWFSFVLKDRQALITFSERKRQPMSLKVLTRRMHTHTRTLGILRNTQTWMHTHKAHSHPCTYKLIYTQKHRDICVSMYMQACEHYHATTHRAFEKTCTRPYACTLTQRHTYTYTHSHTNTSTHTQNIYFHVYTGAHIDMHTHTPQCMKNNEMI